MSDFIDETNIFTKGFWGRATARRLKRAKEAESRIAELEAEVKRLKLVGQKMSNLCYNGRQLDRIPEDYRETMGKLYKEWDATIHHTESEDKG